MLLGHIRNQHRRVHTGIVDEDVDLAELRDDVLHHLVHGLDVRDVHIIGGSLAAHGADVLAGLAVVRSAETVDDDVRAVLGELGGDDLTDTLRASRYQCDFTFEHNITPLLRARKKIAGMLPINNTTFSINTRGKTGCSPSQSRRNRPCRTRPSDS